MRRSFLASMMTSMFNVINYNPVYKVKPWLTWNVVRSTNDQDHWFEYYGFEKSFFIDTATGEVKQLHSHRAIIESIASKGELLMVKPEYGDIIKVQSTERQYYTLKELFGG